VNVLGMSFGFVRGKFYGGGVILHGKISEGMSGRGEVVRGACPDHHAGLQVSRRNGYDVSHQS